MSNDLVKLVIGGDEYTGWEEVVITRAIDEAASSFNLAVTQELEKDGDKPIVKPGDEVKIQYGNELLVTGYVDSVNVTYDDLSHSILIVGRSKTKDLIDCSALNTAQFKNLDIKQIATELAKPYNVHVVMNNVTGLKKHPNFQVEQDGETVLRAIERLANDDQVVISDTPQGQLLLARIGESQSKNRLVKSRTQNTGILDCSFKIDESGRYSKIIVKGQQQGTDQSFGKQVAQVSAEVTDDEVKRTRVKIIRADTEVDTRKASEKAHWQMLADAGKATEVIYTVQDWRGNANEIWRENQLVLVADNLCGIKDRYLVVSKVVYQINNSSGTTCQLTLNPPEAFHKEESENKSGNKDVPVQKKLKLKKKIGQVTTEFWKEDDGV